MQHRFPLSRRALLKIGAAAALSLAAAPAGAAFRPAGKKGFCGPAHAWRPDLGCDWYYNWSLSPHPDIDIPFAPMVWGWNPKRTPQRLRLLDRRAPILFGFNEPDGRNQANLSVPEALDAWPKFQDRADEIVSPSCVNSRGRWMTNFMLQAERRRLKIDSIGFHSYSAPNLEQVVERLEDTWRLYGRPIWVTEIGVADWRSAQGRKRNRYGVEESLRFMTDILAYMDRTPWIRGYCWFSGGTFGDGRSLSTSAFFDGSGRPSPVFRLYAGH
ncbi:glycosyl hydrolase [Paracoccus sp. TOH]|uniref:Glycosyl hydrolase n=1 Tax=Paracoccus simplex TaxID=2086346 RepID=A0ABV7RWX3_9RHOB|nr:glycosyl hydrolase [Paracoccus sp. TOH]WJS86234.1 glycoside hydrolase family protein [Paracoccus sp. TOH]